MRVELQSAYILHRRNFRNTSVILEIFTPDFGRIGLVAKGVRTIKSKTNGLLQSFQPLLMSWVGRSDLKTLTHVEADGYVNALVGTSFAQVFYLNELLLRLLQREDAHEEIFQLYNQTLSNIRHAKTDISDIERLLRLFELKLLQELGYGLMLEHEADTGKNLNENSQYQYVVERGPVLVSGVEKTIGPVVSGKSLLAFAQYNLTDGECLRDCKRVMRYVLKHYLGDQPLQSRMLYSKTSK